MRGDVEECSTAGEMLDRCQAKYSRGKRGETPNPFPKHQGDIFSSEKTSSWVEA